MLPSGWDRHGLAPGARVRDLATGQVGTIVAVGQVHGANSAPAPRHPLDSLIDLVAERVERRLAERREAQARQTRLVPVREAAVMLGRTAEAVYHMIRRGELRGVRSPAGGRVFIELREIENYIARRRTRAAAEEV